MGETTTVTAAGGSFSAYVARPERNKAPAVVVIQEIFGVNQVMRDLTDAWAAAGYLAICPDLFWRIEPGIDITDKTDAEWKRAFELFNAFDIDKGVKDLGATIAHARADRTCSGPVGSVGYCLGGLLAFLTATRTDVDAAVSYYGVNIDKHLAEARTLVTPVLLHIAGADEFVDKAAQEAIAAGLKRHSNAEVFVYPGRGHAFARPGGEHFDAADAATAQKRSETFFHGRLTR